MERKKPATKFKSLLVLLAAVFAVFVSAVFTTQVAAQPNPYAFAGYEQSSGDEYERGGYTLEQIRELLQQGDTSGYKRIYNQYTGPAMYQMSAAETMEVFGPPGIQQFNNFTYNVRAVHGAGRPCNESIVLVLLGDGFTAGNGHGNVGYWPNPGVGTFLDFAVEFAYTITNMHPFSLFSDYFKIYAVETPSTQGIRAGVQGSPIDAPYPGTYLGSFFTEPGSFGIRVNRSAHALNISRWASSNAIMTQMILNSTEFGGVAFGAGAGYGNVNTLGVTSRWVGSGPASVGGGWTRPAYHSIVVHEIGHNFGRLMDEHSDLNVSAWHMGRANIALASDTDAQLKWRHWLGHAGITRRTTDAPVGFMFPSPAVPSGTTGDCKMRGWRANFCAVCSAELTRRMALISGDLFEAGLGPDGSSRPVTPTVTVAPQHTRILPYAFHGNTSLTTITIPASVTEIGNFAFIGATGLTEIVNHSTTPQQINYTTFAGVYRPGVDLHVPPGMAQAYISAGWAGFNFIDGGSLFTGITANPANLPRIGGNSTITAVGIGLNPSDMRIAAFHNNAGSPLYIQSPTGTADSVSANIAFPANADLNSRQYTVRVSMDGGTTWQIYPVATITIAPFPGIILTPDSATATASVGAGVDGRVLIELWNTSSSTMEVTLEGRFTGLYGTNTSFVPALYNMAGSLIAHRNLDQPGWTPANLGFTYGAITLAAGEGWLGFIGTGGNVASGIPLASIWVTSAVTFGLNPTSVTLTDANAQTVDATGTATGAITFGALSPANANISLTDAGGAVDVAFTGAMPNAGSPDAITGTHTVTVTREGESETLTIILDIPAYIPATTFGLNPISVTLSDANAQTVDATGNATGAITFGALSPANANISLTDAGGAVDVAFTGAMPNAGSPNAITGTHTVSVTREGESETLTIILDIPAYIPTTFPVTVSGSHAGVTGAGNYAIGITVTVNAGTREGFNFAGWT
ncbi:MAG: M64 family metallo-endopeptidase, partial [Defluviitaleaceae bacterium]|nr:M64 family metallo-endopeptidase [Defluviitaleaceae bacterium]